MLKNKFQLLVFDWDGTLSDSLGYIIHTMQTAIHELELEPRPAKSIREIVGLGLEQGIAVLYPSLPGKHRKQLLEKYRSLYRRTTDKQPPLYPHMEKMLKTLYTEGYYLAVATGKSRRGIDRALRESDLMSYFHSSRCADEAFSKPHPQMLEEIMADLDVKPIHTLMIGDSEYDLQMAINAGTASVAVDYGAHDRKRLLKFNPLECFDNLNNLPAWLSALS